MSDFRSTNMNRDIWRGPPNSLGIPNNIRKLEQNMEMLERRRGLLHFEQRMLNNEMYTRKRPYENDIPRRDFENVSYVPQVNDNIPRSGYNFVPSIPNKKRHVIRVWDHDRLNMNQDIRGPRHVTFMEPQRQSSPKPLMSIRPNISRRIPEPVPQRNRRDFVPKKVTKPKARPVNTKRLDIHEPVLVNMDEVAQRLLPGQVPSQRVAGRLELALGFILKDMRKRYCVNSEATALFNSKKVQRSIKQSIRERLQVVMLNKVVGKFLDIVDIYRRAYPVNTDKEILDIAIFTADAEKLTPSYLSVYLDNKLDEIFERLRLLSQGKDEEVIKIIKSRPVFIKESAEDCNTRIANTRAFYVSLVDAFLEERIPQILPNFKERIIQLFEQFKGENNGEVGKDLGKNEGVTTSTTKENTQTTDTEELNSVVEMKETPMINNSSNRISQIEETSQPKETSQLQEMSQVDDNTKQAVDESAKNEEIKEREIQKAVEVDDQLDSKPAQVADDSLADISIDTPTQQSKCCTPPKYFVKVQGKPELPNRADAYKFLKKMNSITIKKHKVLPNLLVVGFKEEKDFNDAIAASGSLVGKSCVIITPHDMVLQNSSLPSSKEIKTVEKSAHLENQVTNLELSNRKEDDVECDMTIKKETETDVSEVSNETQIKIERVYSTIVSDNPKQLCSVDTDKKPKVKTEISESNSNNPSNKKDEDYTEDNENGSKAALQDTAKESKGNENVKSNRSRETPLRQSRQSIATPRTLRARRSSRLMPNN